MTPKDSKQILNNHNVLWLIIGVFLFPAIGSIEGLIMGFLKLSGVSNTSTVIYAIIFDGLITLGLLFFSIWVYKNWTAEKGKLFLALSLKDIKVFGLIVLLMIVVGRIVSFLNLQTVPEEVSAMDSEEIINMQYDMAILTIINTAISFFREVLLFIIFFMIIFKNRNRKSHNHQQELKHQADNQFVEDAEH